MWLLDAAKSAQKNATGYVATIQEKASEIVATVQDEAHSVLESMAYSRSNPVEEPVYEELEAYNAFKETFVLESKTEEIAEILEEDSTMKELHSDLVPMKLTYEEFWTRFFFRQLEPENFQSLEETVQQAKKSSQDPSSSSLRDQAPRLESKPSSSEESLSECTAAPKNDSETNWKEVLEMKEQEWEDRKNRLEHQLNQLEEENLELVKRVSSHENQGFTSSVLDTVSDDTSGAVVAYLDELHKLITSTSNFDLFEYTAKEDMRSIHEGIIQLCLAMKETASGEDKEKKWQDEISALRAKQAESYARGVVEGEANASKLLEEREEEKRILEQRVEQLESQNVHEKAETEEKLKREIVHGLQVDVPVEGIALEEVLRSARKLISEEAKTAVSASNAEVGQGQTVGVMEDEVKLWKARALKMKKLKDEADKKLNELGSSQVEALREQMQELELQRKVEKEEAEKLRAEVEEKNNQVGAMEQALKEKDKDSLSRFEEGFEEGMASARKENKLKLVECEEEVKEMKSSWVGWKQNVEGEISSLRAEMVGLIEEKAKESYEKGLSEGSRNQDNRLEQSQGVKSYEEGLKYGREENQSEIAVLKSELAALKKQLETQCISPPPSIETPPPSSLAVPSLAASKPGKFHGENTVDEIFQSTTNASSEPHSEMNKGEATVGKEGEDTEWGDEEEMGDDWGEWD